MTKNNNSAISVLSAAKLLDLKPRQIQRLCAQGALKAFKLGRAWIVEIDSVLRYQRAKPGIKPGQKLKRK